MVNHERNTVKIVGVAKERVHAAAKITVDAAAFIADRVENSDKYLHFIPPTFSTFRASRRQAEAEDASSERRKQQD